MTSQPYIPASELDELIAALTDECVGKGGRRHSTLRLSSAKLLQGHFRTARSASHEISPDGPRPFRIDDPPGNIDLNSTNGRPLGEQIILETLRCRQRVFEADLDFKLLLDASRSMLARDAEGHSKLKHLYTWATAFIDVASWAKFLMHVLVGNELWMDRPMRGRESVRLLSGVLSSQLPQGLRMANMATDPCEPATVRTLIDAEIRRKRRGVAVIISDFLDDARGYYAALMQLAVTHRIILVDVATELDRTFPVASWFEHNAQSVPLREGARHLESCLGGMPVPAKRARDWNELQEENLAVLENLGRPRVIRRVVVNSFCDKAIERDSRAIALQVLKQLA